MQSSSNNWSLPHWSTGQRATAVQRVIGSLFLLPTTTPHVDLWSTGPCRCAWSGVLSQDSILDVLADFGRGHRPIDSNHQKSKSQKGFHRIVGFTPLIARNSNWFDQWTIRANPNRIQRLWSQTCWVDDMQRQLSSRHWQNHKYVEAILKSTWNPWEAKWRRLACEWWPAPRCSIQTRLFNGPWSVGWVENLSLDSTSTTGTSIQTKVIETDRR